MQTTTDLSFNSSVVQFRECFYVFYLPIIYVSIPVWYNLEPPVPYINPTPASVSIPVWYNLELMTVREYILQVLFQFQCGTI